MQLKVSKNNANLHFRIWGDHIPKKIWWSVHSASLKGIEAEGTIGPHSPGSIVFSTRALSLSKRINYDSFKQKEI